MGLTDTLNPGSDGTSRDSLNSPKGPDLDGSFQPIRGRNLAAAASTGVSGSQPTGRAPPALTSGALDSEAAHVRAPCAVMPIASLINLAIPISVRSVLPAHISPTLLTVERRVRALPTFREIDAKLAPYRARWVGRLPAGSPARSINLPLLHLLVNRFGYPDRRTVLDIAAGMPIAGDIPVCDTIQPRETLEECTSGIVERNATAIGRVQRFRNT